MLDHVFLDAVGALGAALSDSLLERNRQEDRLAVDVLLGDVMWETSVSLPGDSDPSPVRADLTLEWPTWSQSAWRSWVLGEALDDPPEIEVEVVFRLQRLTGRPATEAVLGALGEQEPPGFEHFERAAVVAEEDLGTGEVAMDIAYEGTYRLADPADAPRRGLFGADPIAHLGPAHPEPPARGPSLPDRYSDGGHAAAEGGHARESARQDQAGGSRNGGIRPDDNAGNEGLPLAPSGAAARGGLSPAMAASLAGLGRWVASNLVRLADLNLATFPAPEDE